jgi:hypothetical protein
MTQDNEAYLNQRGADMPGGDSGTQFSGLNRMDEGIVPPSLFDLLAVQQLVTENRDQLEVKEEQDVPAVEPSLTSSVGALWPPAEASFDRIKGIYTPGIIDNPDSMGDLIREVDSAEGLFRRGDITRVSLRAVVDNEFIQEAKKDPRIADLIESQFNLDGTQPVFEGASLVYFGSNHPSRQPLEIEKIVENVEDAFYTLPQSPDQLISRAQVQGYELSTLPKDLDPTVIDQVSALYQRFGWTQEEVEEILKQPNNIIAVASLDGEIVSAGIAEMALIPIGSHEFRIVEITEAATKEEHSRRGLYTAVSTSLLLELARLSKEGQVLGGELDLVYGECNGNAPGVLKTARMQGRRFAFEDGPDGILFQHVPIAGLPKKTRYNDLFPAYISRQDLYRRYLNETA